MKNVPDGARGLLVHNCADCFSDESLDKERVSVRER